jgi:hypothetical protein
MKVQLSAEEERKVDLQHKLHVMNPAQKRDAMEELGLVAKDYRGRKRAEWQQGMRNLNLPGYLTQSESFYNFL